MKLQKDLGNKDFGHKKFAFRIDEKHQMKAIFALINLYQHKIRTPVQEIICNARDAHREVGKPDHTFKVEVTDTQFIVRDYGSGIDPDKAQNIFCSIGESTKTNDNTQTGGFGIGAKSPLAYTNQFEVISYVNGIKYHYMIAKNGEMLDMNLVSQEETKVVNGTKVIVPIKSTKNLWGKERSDKEKFINAVKHCCYFWETRPSFNHEIEPLDVLRLKGKANLGYYNSKHFNANLAVIDGIPYNGLGYGNKVVFFNTGDIMLHETRERLNDTAEAREHNIKQINKAINQIEIEFNNTKTLMKYIGDNLLESLKELSKYDINFKFRKNGIIFKKNIFFELKDCGHYKKELDIYKSYKGERYPYNQRYTKTKECNIFYKETEFYYNDTGDKQQKVSRRVKGYLNQFVTNKENKNVYVFNDKSKADMFNAKNLSTLEIPKIVRGGAKKQSDEITITELCAYGQNRRHRRLDSITTKYLYMNHGNSIDRVMRKFCENKGYTVCLLSKDSINRVKGHKNFTEYFEWKSNYKLSQKEINSVYYRASRICNVDFTEVLDEQLKELRLLRNKRSTLDIVSYSIPRSLYTKAMEVELVKIDVDNARIDVIESYMEKEYPLMRQVSKVNTEYINALYSYRKNLHTTK